MASFVRRMAISIIFPVLVQFTVVLIGTANAHDSRHCDKLEKLKKGEQINNTLSGHGGRQTLTIYSAMFCNLSRTVFNLFNNSRSLTGPRLSRIQRQQFKLLPQPLPNHRTGRRCPNVSACVQAEYSLHRSADVDR